MLVKSLNTTFDAKRTILGSD